MFDHDQILALPHDVARLAQDQFDDSRILGDPLRQFPQAHARMPASRASAMTRSGASLSSPQTSTSQAISRARSPRLSCEMFWNAETPLTLSPSKAWACPTADPPSGNCTRETFGGTSGTVPSSSSVPLGSGLTRPSVG